MHETAVLKNIIKKIVEVGAREKSSSIKSLTIKLGALSHFSPEHFREHFSYDSRGTIAEHAQLNIIQNTDQSDPMAQEVILESIELS
jgi:hydrogenase nickel incorporation protein HypA/HybF